MGRKKIKNYKLIVATETIAGLLNYHCKHCGSVRIVVRKQLFKNKAEHLQKICADCYRNNDYLSQYELPHIECFNPYETEKNSFYIGE